MTEESRRWIEAAKLLLTDASARVECPRCGQGILKTIEVPLSTTGGAELHMSCPLCNAYNAALRRPTAGSADSES